MQSENRPDGSKNLVGRWALVRLAINGKDLTNQRVTNAGAVYYTFTADGRFRIVHGDSVSETGSWLVDTTASPAFFDHIPHVDGKAGPYVPGIFAIDGDTLRISIVAPNPTRRHPTEFRSSAADSSWLLVLRRPTQ
ncbi:MAG: TIGR03067 domain-containing protein [Gemmatimonadaceae bacterium]